MSKRFTRIMGVLSAVFLFPLFALAQKVVTGHVLSKTDQSPVPGVSVIIKGTRIGTSTGVDGSFALKAKEGDVLIISGIGVTQAEETVTGSTLNIIVMTNARELHEVVVTATGIKKEVKRVGYALQVVDAAPLTQAREPDPVNALKGEVAGLEVNINPEIGHPAQVIMRGENAKDANNNPIDAPIFVVDGVPISSDTYNLSADDIENFTVLKGPNAAALYGFQGRNGAIIITTKKGAKEKGRLVVTVNSSNQFNKGFIALPKYQDTYGPGDNGKYAFGGGGSSAGNNYFGGGATGKGINDNNDDLWGPQFRGQLLPQYDGAYTPGQSYTTTFADGSTYTGHVQPTPWIARGKDNLKKFIQTGILSANSIAVSSSTDKTDVRLSMGETYQKGITPNTLLHNASATLSLVERFDPKFTATAYLNYSRQFTPNIPDVSYGPNSVIYNILIWSGADWSIKDMRNYWQPGYTGVQQKFWEYSQYNNPWFMSYEWLRSHNQNNEYGYLSLNYKPVANLEIQFRPSFTAYDMFNSEKMPYSAGVGGRPLRQGDYREDRRQLFDNNEDLQVIYHKNRIGGFLDLSALGGGTIRNFNYNADYASTNYLLIPGLYSFSNSQGAVTGTTTNANMLVLSAYYSIDLGFKSYLTANITGRVDKSSAMNPAHASYYYPSFNLATVVSDYLKLPDFISFLKLRGSYAESKDGGTTSTIQANTSGTPGGYGYNWVAPFNGPTYQFVKSYTLSPTYSSQISARYTDQQINADVNTRDRKALEFGVDIRVLKNRLGLDVTRYHYRNTGIIGQGVSNAYGYAQVLTNGDIYTNDGWEATFSGKPVVNPHGLSWDVTANFFTFIRKWVSYNSAPDNWAHNGTRTDLVYSNGFVRTPDGQKVVDKASGVYILYSDLQSPAQKIYGHSDPDWQWGLINTVSYKSLSLRFQFDGLVGGVFNDYVRQKTLQAGRHIEDATGAIGAARPSDEARVPAYTAPGVNLAGPNGIQLNPVTGAITNMKDLTATTNSSKALVQSFVTHAASAVDESVISKTYVKLREVTLNYKIPASIFGKHSIISNANIALVGRNLLYFFPNRYKDVDVDQYSQDNNSSLQTPTTRSFGFNLNFTF